MNFGFQKEGSFLSLIKSIGAFTNRNNKGTKSKPEQFTTGLVYGDNIILEYIEPQNVESKAIISVGYVIQGYRYIKLPNVPEAGFGESGPCQVNVNCPEGINWQNEKEAVALIIVNGNRYCTGSLVNNTANDLTPYFLTADHCLGGWANSSKLDAVTNPNANLWSFYWNYQSPGCSNTAEPPILSTVGATVVANNSISDFALLRLTENPQNEPGTNLYYLGWDRSGNTGTGGVGIHHPNGDVKKIATHTSTPSSNGNFWNLYWSSTQSGYSVTEGGSSGSPLLNNSHQVIGQLYGGSSVNCSDPSNDLGTYGKLSVSWTGANATDSRRRLRDWLDPLNSNVSTLNGVGCLGNLSISGPPYFCTSQDYSINNLPRGATVTWSATGSISISGSNTANPVSVSKSTDGSGTLTANINTACGSFNVVKNNIQAGNPALPTFISYPASRCVDQPYELTPILPAGTSITAISGLNGGVQEPLVETSYGVYIVPPNVYSIMLTLNNNCGSSTFTRLFPRSNCFSYGYSVYPNPANQTLTIDYQGNTGIEENSSESLMLILEEKQIKLFNDKGTEVKTATIRTGKSKTVLDTRDLPEGTYFLHITEAKETIKKQIIIKH